MCTLTASFNIMFYFLTIRWVKLRHTRFSSALSILDVLPRLGKQAFVKTVTFAINKENNEDFINVVAEKDKPIYNFFFTYFSEVCIAYNRRIIRRLKNKQSVDKTNHNRDAIFVFLLKSFLFYSNISIFERRPFCLCR